MVNVNVSKKLFSIKCGSEMASFGESAMLWMCILILRRRCKR